METIVLVIHLIIALAIIGLVLIQRSSGGGLGIGGGGMGDFASARGTANTLTKATTFFAFAFFVTSLTLAWLATNNGEQGILDSLDNNQAQIEMQVEEPDVPLPAAAPAEPEVPTAE